MTVESLQDTYYSKNNNSSFGISLGIGTSGNSGNAGFDISNSNGMTDSQWVNNQTSLTADGKVDIIVGNNTNIIGAVIASNTDNLTLTTNSLTYSNLNDFFTTEQKGFGFGTSIGAGTDKGETNLHPQGQTTVSLQSIGEEKEQITKATIGNGTIIIGGNEINEANNNLDLIRDLNRDVNNSQEITKDQITGALNGSMTIDNRLFTEAGRNEIASDFENLPQNTYTVLDYTVLATGRALDPNRIGYYGNRAFEDENLGAKKSHEQAAEAYGNYVGSNLVGGTVRFLGEVGQFFYYTGKDISSRLTEGKPGKYQPYCYSCEGGLKDSYGDIMNVIRGSNGNYNKDTFPNGQTEVDIYNNQDYQKYKHNGKKW